MESIQLRPLSPTTLAKPPILPTLSSDTIPRLETLREIEREISEYKRNLEKRTERVDESLRGVEGLYMGLKDKVKGIKKEPVDALPTQRPSKATSSLRIPQPSLVSPAPTATNTATGTGTVPSSSSATPAPGLTKTSSGLAPGQSSVVVKSQKTKKRRRPEDEDFADSPSVSSLLPNNLARMSTPVAKGSGQSYGGGKEHKNKKSKVDEWDSRTTGHRKLNDFSPPLASGLPPRPPRNPLPVPQTDNPNEVNDDFSDRKQPSSQVPAHTYWNYLEPWLRGVREEEVGLLGVGGDDEEYWEMPPLGRHYSEIWEELDRHYYQLSSIPSKPSRPPNPYAAFTHPAPAQPSQPITLSSLSLPHSIPPPNTGVRWDPASLTEGELVTDERGSGPLTERIFSAFLFDKVKLEEEGEVGRGFGLGRGVGQGTVGDLEERLMKECKSLGLIMNEPDYSQPEDDQIASELRRCQRALKQQIAINEARKRRLLRIAELRLSYSEYEEVKEGLERHLSTLFNKLGSSGVPKLTKKKKKEKERAAQAAGVDMNGGPTGVNGLGIVGMDGYLEVSDECKEVLKVLRRWVDVVGSGFEQMEGVKGLPKRSIYEGIEDELKSEEESGDGKGDRDRDEDEDGDGDVSMIE